MSRVVLLFPHHLGEDHPCLGPGDRVLMVEDSLFFGDCRWPASFHKQKLVLHRASMTRRAEALQRAGHRVDWRRHGGHADIGEVLGDLAAAGVRRVAWADPVDDVLSRRLARAVDRHGLQAQIAESPLFLNTRADNEAFFGDRRGYRMADFYRHQRQRFGVLLEADGESPAGGRWSFDEDNRKKLPARLVDQLPPLPQLPGCRAVDVAVASVGDEFPRHPGDAEPFIYPTDATGAETWLADFLQRRLDLFGPYEDTMAPGAAFLFHSVLTPALNTGLLTPRLVLDAALDTAQAREVPLASLEGFVRQVIGWREYVRAVYDDLGVELRNGNAWEHTQPVPACFYELGGSGLAPVDDVLDRVRRYGYCHHIERLMVLGGLLFLLRVEPTAIYRWFMEMFIDAYDWVMVPNVYGMSQQAAGGLMTTKPYFSGSNYLLKMGRWSRGDWCAEWDGLYWSFILDHAERLAGNPRWAMMVRMARRLDADTRRRHRRHAEACMERLFA